MPASIYQDVIGIQAAGQAYSLGSRFQECSQTRPVRLADICGVRYRQFRHASRQARAEETAVARPPPPAP